MMALMYLQRLISFSRSIQIHLESGKMILTRAVLIKVPYLLGLPTTLI